MPPDPQTLRNPPIDYAVAVWIGMPDEEVERGLREGWIRGPQPAPERAAQVDDQAAIQQSPAEVAVERERLQAIACKLDRTLDAATFDAAWREAGATEHERAGRLTDFLSRTLGIAGAGAAASLARLESAAQSASGNARFIRLDGRSGAELESLAHAHAGMRAALASHDAWAFVGDRALAARTDPDGRLDRFDRDTGEAGVSDAWITDRARHAAWLTASEPGGERSIAGAGWRFVDRSDAGATLELRGSEGSAPNQVLFARNDGDTVVGGLTTDRIHGGDGADALLGRSGDDLIEGGGGDDLLIGGSGRDVLAGQRGDDDLDGGRGDDLLRGGSGNDVYRFESGAGRDTIDDDGGEIVVDDVTLSGTMRKDGGAWSNADGSLRFTLDGTPDDGEALVIERTDGNASDALRIERWRQGAFGFTLAADEDASTEESASTGRDARHTEEAVVAESSDAADLASLVADPLGDATLVDARSFVSALDRWSIASPPDVDAAVLDDATFVNDTMLADALAGEGVAGDDSDAGGGLLPLDWAGMLQPPAAPDAGLAPVRPATLLRAVTP